MGPRVNEMEHPELADPQLRRYYQKLGFRDDKDKSTAFDKYMYSTIGRVARGRKRSVASTRGLDD